MSRSPGTTDELERRRKRAVEAVTNGGSRKTKVAGGPPVRGAHVTPCPDPSTTSPPTTGSASTPESSPPECSASLGPLPPPILDPQNPRNPHERSCCSRREERHCPRRLTRSETTNLQEMSAERERREGPEEPVPPDFIGSDADLRAPERLLSARAPRTITTSQDHTPALPNSVPVGTKKTGPHAPRAHRRATSRSARSRRTFGGCVGLPTARPSRGRRAGSTPPGHGGRPHLVRSRDREVVEEGVLRAPEADQAQSQEGVVRDTHLQEAVEVQLQ
jgi:hypothetical protein